jgi:hypothetical protein
MKMNFIEASSVLLKFYKNHDLMFTTTKPIFSWLEIQTDSFVLHHLDTLLIDCCLIFSVPKEHYQNIDRNALFNLKPELRGPFTNGEFLPNYPIQITATLQPDLLIHLQDHATREAATTYLQTLSQTQPDHILLNPESWYALDVTQTQDTLTTGYRTLWHYLNPAHLAAETPSSEYVTAQLTEFFKDSFNFDDLPLDDLAIAPQLDRLTQSLTDSLETLWDDSDHQLTNAFTEITDAFTEIVEVLDDLTETDAEIYPTMIDFFTQEDWIFSKIPGELALQLPFQGQNGTWNCYAKAREDQQQFVFYSICSILAPKPKRSKIAHFLTLANYGLLLGNFELDYNDGEIRYKTSIDVEGDQISPALIKRLVYTNIAMMDEYLPGIRAIIEENIDPVNAIALIETPTPRESA